MSEPESPFKLTPVTGGFQFAFEVRTVKGPRQTKKAQFDQFEIVCDEGKNMGGDDTAPPPLAHFASAIAF